MIERRNVPSWLQVKTPRGGIPFCFQSRLNAPTNFLLCLGLNITIAIRLDCESKAVVVDQSNPRSVVNGRTCHNRKPMGETQDLAAKTDGQAGQAEDEAQVLHLGPPQPQLPGERCVASGRNQDSKPQ